MSNYAAPGHPANIAANCAALGVRGSFTQINRQISVRGSITSFAIS